MALSWSARRQLLYYAVASAVCLVLLVALQQAFFSRAPTCFDNRQNGDEAGVDCGGSCSLVCSQSAYAPQVLWARALPVGGNLYTGVAYVQNPNAGSGAKAVQYSMQLLDNQGLIVATRQGAVDLPPVPTVPVVEPNINIGARSVAKTLFSFSTTPVWSKVGPETIPLLRVGERQLAPDGTRLSATITNESLQDAEDITVVAVLFDASNIARAASKSFIGQVPRKSSQQVVFTWPQETDGIVRAEITVLPSF